MADAADLTFAPPAEEEQRRAMSPMGLAWRRLMKKRIAMVALAFIVTFYTLGILAPLLGELGIIKSYTDQNLEMSWKAPSGEHPFGTDRLGRDQLSRVIWAAQTTTIVTVASLITGGIVLGVGLGLLSGYMGGWVDSLIMRAGEILGSLPSILMLILINATMKDQVRAIAVEFEEFTGISGLVRKGVPDYLLVFGALSLFGWVGGSRIIRSQVLALRETEFVMAARSLGATTPHILFRHLLPNVSNIIIVSLSMGLAGIAGSEIILTWFGVGIQPPQPSFGAMLFEAGGVRQLNSYPWMLLFPGGVVTALFFAFNLLGDALTDVFTPKAR